jgi:hypothetical protein
MTFRITPATPSIRGLCIHVCLELFDLMTRRHRLYVADHVGIFAGSLLHRGDWNHE